MKKCNLCKKIKSDSAFNKDRSNSDDLSRTCRGCRKKYRKERTSNLKSRKEIKYPDFKRCSSCKIIKPSSDFFKSVDCIDGLDSRCKECKTRKTSKIDFKKREEFFAMKSAIGCKLCGEKRGYILGFHHIKPEEKEYSLNYRMWRNRGNGIWDKEIKKVICLCPNCSRHLHHWYNRLFKYPNKSYLFFPIRKVSPLPNSSLNSNSFSNEPAGTV